MAKSDVTINFMYENTPIKSGWILKKPYLAIGFMQTFAKESKAKYMGICPDNAIVAFALARWFTAMGKAMQKLEKEKVKKNAPTKRL